MPHIKAISWEFLSFNMLMYIRCPLAIGRRPKAEINSILRFSLENFGSLAVFIGRQFVCKHVCSQIIGR